MINKALKTRRRSVKTRITIRKSGRPRICIHRSLKHFYAQLIVPGEKGDRVLTSASSLDSEVKAGKSLANNIQLAQKVGAVLAKRILALNIKQVALDRSGKKFHARLQAFKASGIQAGLEF